MKTAALVVSVFLNLGLAYLLFDYAIDGCAVMSDGRVGVLTQDVDIGVFDTDEALFTLPEGLVVRERSASGPGWFEPHGFWIVVTADNERFVNYEPNAEVLARHYSEFYSAEVSESTR